ncbi:biotin-independent malonate decarboxylase subunit beta [Lactobacillus sp. CBA3605]|uniref:biotin-independent malonate decarboxylase subunit beta n=1 Tax=Lactobacillus sp. CBA3605 TaxID=2099788 RepID=UPI000CFC2A00|nr:biotin-independent malonate decarboxylase subunit beta [Lactobacillus sp. CBA3605]AVK62097.1 biotin-independent malonate decarboxylase subunit beta [Lactobacillus sp. CBA3605]
MQTSFVELHARERAQALLDDGTARELVGPFDNLISPHLEPQGIVPESDDGVVLMQGQLDHQAAVVISIEGSFQGGGIGEVNGAKIVAALEQTLKDNQQGHSVYPVLILDTGGVRLQEANYGLLAISEIHNAIVALKSYVPVIGIIPGRVGSFGGMSITSATLSYLITTKKARVGLNGPEVIEQEAGVREFDASDKDLIWDTLGTTQRAATGIVDEVIDDQVSAIKQAVVNAIRAKKDSHRTERNDFYLTLLDQLDLTAPLDTAGYRQLYATIKPVKHQLAPAKASDQLGTKSRGRLWFEKLTGITNAKSEVATVLYANQADRAYLAIVADEHNRFPRVRHGEVGLQEGFTVATVIDQIVAADADKPVKRPIVLIVDVPSQAYGYKEELIGIHLSLAAAAVAEAKARQAGHPVIAFIPGDAVSGGFLSFGLQSNRLILLDDESITVQAMSKASAARITQRTIAELEAATKHVPAMAYDVKNYQKLGALSQFVDGIQSWSATPAAVAKVNDLIETAVQSTVDQPTDLHMRYETAIAKASGRVATRKMRAAVAEQWQA